MAIPQRALIVSGAFGAGPDAPSVGARLDTPTAGEASDAPSAGVALARSPGVALAPTAGAGLTATAVVAAIARGLRAAGCPEPDVCPLEQRGDGADGVRKLLDALDFDARMRAARAVIVGTECLHERTLAGSITFEIATRARQGGVPAYAVTGENALSAFDARILDLQLIIEARSIRTLAAAGRRLAALM